MKRLLLVVALVVVLAPAAAMADTLDILFAGGTWAWGGGASALTASSTTIQWELQDSGGNPVPLCCGKANPYAVALPVSITTGAGIGGFNWAPGGSIVIGGCSGACLAGTFVSIQQGVSSSGFTIIASFVAAVLDPAVLAYFELPNVPEVYGSIHFDLIGGINPIDGGHGAVGSGDINVSQVPEPGTLAMFGSGLIGLAGVLRRKFNL